MPEQVKADEKLARFVAGLSPHMQIEMLNALQGYHEQFYNELVHAGSEHLARTQGKVQAIVADHHDCPECSGHGREYRP